MNLNRVRLARLVEEYTAKIKNIFYEKLNIVQFLEQNTK